MGECGLAQDRLEGRGIGRQPDVSLISMGSTCRNRCVHHRVLQGNAVGHQDVRGWEGLDLVARI